MIKKDFSSPDEDKRLFLRGINTHKHSYLVIQFLGISLTLIAIAKTLISLNSVFAIEWKLFTAGSILFLSGNYIGQSKTLQKLFNTQSTQASRSRDFAIKLMVFVLFIVIASTKLLAENVDMYKSYFFGEGGIVEWLQVILLAYSIRVSMLISEDIWIMRINRYLRLFYICISCLLSFLLLEELAWGQVLFSWKTPENIARLNAQGETTFHNLKAFQNILDISFFFISVLCIVVFILIPYILKYSKKSFLFKNKFSLTIFLPPDYIWPVFVLTSLISFYVMLPLIGDIIINRDQEWAELLFYSGILISLLRTYILLGDKQTVSKVPSK